MFGLAETKVGNARALEIAANLKGWKFHCIDPIGYSGGIWLFWRANFATIEVLMENRFFLHVRVKTSSQSFMMTIIYPSTVASVRNVM